MIKTDSIDALIIILAIIVPGYITRFTISMTRVREEKTEFENLIDSIVFGSINTLLFLFPILYLWKIKIINLPSGFHYDSLLKNIFDIVKPHTFATLPFCIFYLFVVPILIGWLLGKWKGTIKIPYYLYIFVPLVWILKIIKIIIFWGKSVDVKNNPFPSAWDEFFSGTGPVTLYIKLKSGEKICGIYGEESRVSTNPKLRDIYLEKEILLNKNGSLSGIIENRKGLWVNCEEIEYFRVLPLYKG